jgi:hypothetical protein
MTVPTYGDVWAQREALCAKRGLTVWEAEAMVASGEIYWRNPLAVSLAVYRLLLEEPPLWTPWGY